MHTDTRFKTTRANTHTHAWGLFLSLHWTVKGYVYHKGDATAGRGFFPKYDKRDYMDIAKMLLESAPRLLMRQDLKGRDPLALALELSASDIDPRLDMIVFLEEKKKQVRVIGRDSLTFFLRAVCVGVCIIVCPCSQLEPARHLSHTCAASHTECRRSIQSVS